MGKARRLRQQHARSSSSYPEDARSFELKLLRAHQHLQEIDQMVRVWVDASLKTVTEEPDPERPGGYLTWIDPPALSKQHVALLAGDCLQCLRSALDHLALELAATYTAPLSDELAKRSEFPIFDNSVVNGKDGSARFNQRIVKGAKAGQPVPNSGLSKTASINPAAQAIIEGLQPYQRGPAVDQDPLWWLHVLNNLDKHRVLHVIAVNTSGGFSLSFDAMENIASLTNTSVETIHGPAEGRTAVNRWATGATPVDPRKEMKVHFPPELRVVFDLPTPIVGGHPVVTVLTTLHDHIVSDVLPPLVGFLK